MRQIALWEQVFDARLSNYCHHLRRQMCEGIGVLPLHHHTTDAQVTGPEKEAEILG